MLYACNCPTQPFLHGILDDLARRGWLSRREAGAAGAAELRLTSQGRTEHAAVSQLVDAARERAMQGIAEADYRTVVRTLQRMVANLQPA